MLEIEQPPVSFGTHPRYERVMGDGESDGLHSPQWLSCHVSNRAVPEEAGFKAAYSREQAEGKQKKKEKKRKDKSENEKKEKIREAQKDER